MNRTTELREAIKVREGSSLPVKRVRRLANEDLWIQEAHRATNIRSLSAFLRTIRRAYLDLSSSNNLRNAPKRPRVIDEQAGLQAWAEVRWLSDRERDEVDLQTKTVLRRCHDRIRELEAVEQARLVTLAAQQPAGRVGRLLGLPALNNNPTAEQLKAHRASVLLYLTNALVAVGNAQQAQQETRVQRQLERTSGAGSALGGLGSSSTAEMGAIRGETHASERRAGKQVSKDVPAMFVPAPLLPDEEDGQPPIESVLSAEQIQQFEEESSALLRATQDQLAALRTAEASLLEIGALQSELAHHLTQQAEVTNQIWEDAVTVTGRVGEGNKQLKRARERNRESRVYLLAFLIGASLTLLLLDRIA